MKNMVQVKKDLKNEHKEELEVMIAWKELKIMKADIKSDAKKKIKLKKFLWQNRHKWSNIWRL